MKLSSIAAVCLLAAAAAPQGPDQGPAQGRLQWNNPPSQPVPGVEHGLGGNENNGASLARTIRTLVEDNGIDPMVFVFVNGGASTMYADSADGEIKSETTIIRELIPHILQELEIPHEYEIVEGMGHNIAGYYDRVGLQGLRFLERHFDSDTDR